MTDRFIKPRITIEIHMAAWSGESLSHSKASGWIPYLPTFGTPGRAFVQKEDLTLVI